VLKEWFDNYPDERAVMVFEDDAAPTGWFVVDDTLAALRNPPREWGMITLADCIGMYRVGR
jgi:hypothetical protein